MRSKDISNRCIAIIPARGGSKGIPRKNIMDFCGKPLVAWSIERALQSKHVGEVYVTTEDREIENISKEYGAKIIRRPANLATDTATAEEALLHAIGEIEKHKEIDIVVFLQPTSPLRGKEDIDSAIEKFVSEKADSLLSAARLNSSFFAWEIVNDRLRSITYDYKNRPRRQDIAPNYRENGSIYIFKPEIMKREKNRLGGKMILYPMPLWRSYEIDESEDIGICEYFMHRIIEEHPKINKEDIQLIVYDFDGVLTDNKVLVSEKGEESVFCNRSDGLAVQKIKELGIPQIILSGEKNPVVERRAKKLNIEVIHNTSDKKSVLIDYCKKKDCDLKNVAYIGNDTNDLEIMKLIGHPIAPQDANDKVKDIAKVIVGKKGGEGVIKEFFESVLIY